MAMLWCDYVYEWFVSSSFVEVNREVGMMLEGTRQSKGRNERKVCNRVTI